MVFTDPSSAHLTSTSFHVPLSTSLLALSSAPLKGAAIRMAKHNANARPYIRTSSGLVQNTEGRARAAPPQPTYRVGSAQGSRYLVPCCSTRGCPLLASLVGLRLLLLEHARR